MITKSGVEIVAAGFDKDNLHLAKSLCILIRIQDDLLDACQAFEDFFLFALSFLQVCWTVGKKEL